MKVAPGRLCALIAMLLAAPAAGTRGLRADFVRGDASGDGRLDVTDAIVHLRFLFQSGAPPGCEEAADANDDGKLELDDAVTTLLYLFAEGSLPSPGALLPGPDPSCDALGCAASADLTPAVLLSEIGYHGSDDNDGSDYVELHNRTAVDVSLKGYAFTNGISFSFPEDAVLPAGGYLLVVKDPDHSRWRRVTAPKLGPYEGNLADGGERLTLDDGDCRVETVKYADRAPWPLGADGYGPSLERVDFAVSAEDYHAWRASLDRVGTPGEPNSSAGTPAWPLIRTSAFEPAEPTSTETVRLTVTLDSPRDALRGVTVYWEAVAASTPVGASAAMTLDGDGPDHSTFSAELPAQLSQTLVRVNFEAELADGRKSVLPHPADPRAFISYFVSDREMPSLLPILWVFPKKRTTLPGPVRNLSGVVIQEPAPAGAGPLPPLLVFDGADVRNSTQGQKIRFLKGEEYRGDRTLNMVPEEGGGGSGLMAPHMEHWGFQVFRDLGALAPRADWFRVVDYGSSGKRHTQRLLIEQVNERFLEMNGIDSTGDLYKLDKSNFAKRTNIATGNGSLATLLAGMRQTNAEKRREAILSLLDLDSVNLYSVVSILIENWDGFHNNLYIYNDLSPGARWKVIPWDLDQVCENIRWDFPVTFPLTGQSLTVSRETGPISRPYHGEPDLNERYLDGMRQRIAPGGPFTAEALVPRLDAIEKLLLDDLELQEAALSITRGARRSQIHSAYLAIRTFIQRRVPYLDGVLNPR